MDQENNNKTQDVQPRKKLGFKNPVNANITPSDVSKHYIHNKITSPLSSADHANQKGLTAAELSKRFDVLRKSSTKQTLDQDSFQSSTNSFNVDNTNEDSSSAEQIQDHHQEQNQAINQQIGYSETTNSENAESHNQTHQPKSPQIVQPKDYSRRSSELAKQNMSLINARPRQDDNTQMSKDLSKNNRPFVGGNFGGGSRSGENNRSGEYNNSNHKVAGENASKVSAPQGSFGQGGFGRKLHKKSVHGGSGAGPKNEEEKTKIGKDAGFGGRFRRSDANQLIQRGLNESDIVKYRKKPNKNKFNDVQSAKISRLVYVGASITVGELAAQMAERSVDVVKSLMKLGIIANAGQVIDYDTAELIASSLGHKIQKVDQFSLDDLMQNAINSSKNKVPRPPVVVVMGHVDHGKTSLLDKLRSSMVTAGEAGGITQHIGAYQIKVGPDGFAAPDFANGGANLSANAANSTNLITFIDTPGHEAFSSLRRMGARVTDIAVIVIAGDDGVKPQTIEAINHARSGGAHIIVAINKIDRVDDVDAAVARIQNDLLQYDVVGESMGGDVIFIPISATQNINLDKLLSAILLVADLQSLDGCSDINSCGVVLESKLDKHKGPIVTLLVQHGSLRIGDVVVAGGSVCKVKKIVTDQGRFCSIAHMSSPVEVWGFESSPVSGEKFLVVESERQARDLAEFYTKTVEESKGVAKPKTLDDLFAPKITELLFIIKADTHGSLEAIQTSLNTFVSSEVKLKIVHSGVGGVTESDVALAKACSAMILAFNAKVSTQSANDAHKLNVEIRNYNIIYDLLKDVENIMLGTLKPNIKEEHLGVAEVRQIFDTTKSGKIAGCHVKKGIIKRGCLVRIMRNEDVVYKGKLKTLRRFKEDVSEVKTNFECGIVFDDYDDMLPGDVIEAFVQIEEKRTKL